MSDTAVDLTDYYPGTGIGNVEVWNLGVVLLNTVGSVARLGHVSPASHLDYWTRVGSTSEAMLRDYVDWTSGRDMYPGARDRLVEVIECTGWHRQQVAAVGAMLGGKA